MYEKLVLVTRKTRLEGVVQRFNTRAQARFYLEHAGLDFDEYEREHDCYQRSLELVREQLMSTGLKLQTLERELVPTYLFAASDAVVVLGQDGTVANVAKYVGQQPVIGVNPDPERFDGVLLPFRVDAVRQAVHTLMSGRARTRQVTLAEAVLSTGQRIRAFNDLFIGARTHVSAHYRLTHARNAERQSSSGIIVSTGAGSTGWLASVSVGAAAFAAASGGHAGTAPRFSWEHEHLYFVVREPFVSRHSSANAVVGWVSTNEPLELESLMPSGGVIFGDGVEQDALAFTSGVCVRVAPAQQRAQLVVQGA